MSKKTIGMRPGDRVTVRAFAEIASTLDAAGALEGLPFLPEMLKYCGQTFPVRRRVHKLIQEGVGSSMRRIENVVLLEGTLCDGQAHGHCHRTCFPLWKTAWLNSAGRPTPAEPDRPAGPGDHGRFAGNAPAAPQTPEIAACSGGDASFPSFLCHEGCQVTELMRATKPLPFWHPLRHILELKSRTYSPVEYAAYFLGRAHRRTFKRFFRGFSRKRASPRLGAAPSDDLGLLPGELVEVKSTAEIKATLNPDGRSRGLLFMPGQWAYCGRRLRVLRVVNHMMSEKTGEMRALSRTVILEGVTCDGKAYGGCERGCLVFWKDTWLRRADAPAPQAVADSPAR